MILQILIATITGRAEQFSLLKSELEKQIKLMDLEDEIGILFDCDNREKTIGEKRQDLLEAAIATYIVYMDDDDWPYPNYIEDIYIAITTGCDCVGVKILMTTNELNPQTCCHSLRYPVWASKVDGYDYVRNVTIFNPVKRELALKAGFPSIRFGEDKEYADTLTPLCKTEIFINNPLFHYRYSNLIPYNIKYGFDK